MTAMTASLVVPPGMAAMLRAVKELPDDARRALRAEVADRVVEPQVTMMKARAGSLASHAGVVGPTIRTRRGAAPTLSAGGSGLPGSVVYGAEFGGAPSAWRSSRQADGSYPKRVRQATIVRRSGRGPNSVYTYTRPTTFQFVPHTGRKGRFVYPVIRSREEWAVREWGDIVGRVIDEFNAGG